LLACGGKIIRNDKPGREKPMSDDPQDSVNRLERAEHYIYLAAGYILVLADNADR
jgi:hypothetical protein